MDNYLFVTKRLYTALFPKETEFYQYLMAKVITSDKRKLSIVTTELVDIDFKPSPFPVAVTEEYIYTAVILENKHKYIVLDSLGDALRDATGILGRTRQRTSLEDLKDSYIFELDSKVKELIRLIDSLKEKES